MPELPEVSWTIDGHSVEVDDWSATCASGGFGSMQGVIQNKFSLATQGSVITGYTPQRVMWEGRLTSPPHVKDGKADIFAAGHKTRVEKENERLLFQSRDTSLWSNAADPPHNFDLTSNSISDDVDADVRGSTLFYKNATVPYASGDQQILAFWAPGADIKRVAFSIGHARSNTNFDIRMQKFMGPTGGRTTVGDFSLAAAAADTVNQAVTGSFDAVTLSMRSNTGPHTPSNAMGIRLQNLRVNGKADGDEASTAFVMRTIADEIGFDRHVTGLGLNVLPLDWVDDWASLADYVTMLANGWWRVCEDRGDGPILEAGEWSQSKEWFVSQSQGARLDLVPLELYNRAIVNYEGVDSSPRRVRVVADPNPLLSSGINNVYEEGLDDRQPDDQLATSVAEFLIARYSVPRWAGSIEICGPEAYEYKAGDKLTVTDWDMAESFTHKIVDVTYERDLVTVSVEEDISAARIIANSQNRESRRRRKRIR